MLKISQISQNEILHYLQKNDYCTDKKINEATFGFLNIPNRTKYFLKDLPFEENYKISHSTLMSPYHNNENIIEAFFDQLQRVYGVGSRDIFYNTEKDDEVDKTLDTNEAQVKVIKLFLLKKYSNMYNNFRKNYGKRIIEETGNNICPYCYRSYISVIEAEIGKKSLTPDLDHFYPKSRYPFLAVTLSNLVPSCLLCNERAKNDQDFYKNSIYPPQKIFDEIEFDYDVYLNKIYIKNYKQLIIDPKYKMHLDTFLTQETYATHTEILQNIINKHKKYKQSKIQDLVKHTVGLSGMYVKKIVFYEYEYMNKKTELLYKLKKDLYEKIIK